MEISGQTVPSSPESMPSRDHTGARPPRDRTGNAQATRDFSHIKGWGVDLDRKNRPAYPKERTPPRLDNVPWDQPEDQPIRTKVFHSVERPGITPVFGTGTPPSGLSGRIREFAYKISENDIRHWLLLLFADRVNVVEGIAGDVGRGRVPNVFSEMGVKSELRHNTSGFAGKAVVASAVVGLAYYLLTRRSER